MKFREVKQPVQDYLKVALLEFKPRHSDSRALALYCMLLRIDCYYLNTCIPEIS